MNLPARFTLRLPHSLCARANDAAKKEGVSLNTWIITAISAEIAANDVSRRRANVDPTSRPGWDRSL